MPRIPPCPFCQFDGCTVDVQHSDHGIWYASVFCDQCGAAGPEVCCDSGQQAATEAIEAWDLDRVESGD